MGFEANSDRCKRPVRLLEREQKRALACSLGTRAELETTSTGREALTLSRPQKALCLQATPPLPPLPLAAGVRKKNVCWEIARNVKSPQIPTSPPAHDFHHYGGCWWRPLFSAGDARWNPKAHLQNQKASPLRF